MTMVMCQQNMKISLYQAVSEDNDDDGIERAMMQMMTMKMLLAMAMLMMMSMEMVTTRVRRA